MTTELKFITIFSSNLVVLGNERLGRSVLGSAKAGDLGLISGLGRSAGGEHGSPIQYSCLENPMDRGAWQAMVHRVEKNWIRLSG